MMTLQSRSRSHSRGGRERACWSVIRHQSHRPPVPSLTLAVCTMPTTTAVNIVMRSCSAPSTTAMRGANMPCRNVLQQALFQAPAVMAECDMSCIESLWSSHSTSSMSSPSTFVAPAWDADPVERVSASAAVSPSSFCVSTGTISSARAVAVSFFDTLLLSTLVSSHGFLNRLARLILRPFLRY